MVFAERTETISGGNFHGEYPAKVIKYLERKKNLFLFWFLWVIFLLSPGFTASYLIGSGLFGNWCA